ncbi:WGR domain-containing protein, partial [Pyxidicoccus fallax]
MRRFEFVEGTSSKFWEPELKGSTFIVTFGRIGTSGQRKEKAFPDEAAARREYEKKVAEKLREGYREVTAGDAAAAPPPP